MLRHDKERIVSELAERLKSSQNLLVADYRGLALPETGALSTAPLRGLVGVLDARIRQLEEEGPPADSARAESASGEAPTEEEPASQEETTTTSVEAEPLRENGEAEDG